MPVPDVLARLLTAPGPSGFESGPASIWREAAAGFADVTGDSLGNSFARVPGRGERPLLALLGHVDEIGLIVTYIDDEGRIRFREIGGWSGEVLLSQRVELLTRNGGLPGVIARRRDPQKWEDKRRVEVKDLHIDIGARNRDEARELVRIGDPAVLAAAPLDLRNGRVASRSLDNRLGAYVALEVARRVADAGGAAGPVVAIASVQEEVGDFAGARTGTYATQPDVAVVIDVTPATDVPGGEPEDVGEVKLGDGAVINRGPGINPRLFELLYETAEAEAIPFAVEVTRGNTHTDADAVFLSRTGVPTGVVAVPTRYLHTPNELVELEDVEACVRLITAFAQRLDDAIGFEP